MISRDSLNTIDSNGTLLLDFGLVGMLLEYIFLISPDAY